MLMGNSRHLAEPKERVYDVKKVVFLVFIKIWVARMERKQGVLLQIR